MIRSTAVPLFFVPCWIPLLGSGGSSQTLFSPLGRHSARKLGIFHLEGEEAGHQSEYQPLPLQIGSVLLPLTLVPLSRAC